MAKPVAPAQTRTEDWINFGRTLDETCKAVTTVALLDPDAPCMLGNPFAMPEPNKPVPFLNRPTQIRGVMSMTGPDMEPDVPETSVFLDVLLEIISLGFAETTTFNWRPDPAVWKARAKRWFVGGGTEIRDALAPAYMYQGAEAMPKDKRCAAIETGVLRMLKASQPQVSESRLALIAHVLAPELDALYALPIADDDLDVLQQEYLAQRPYDIDAAPRSRKPEKLTPEQRKQIKIEKLCKKADEYDSNAPGPESVLTDIAAARKLLDDNDPPRVRSAVYLLIARFFGHRMEGISIFSASKKAEAGRHGLDAMDMAIKLDRDNAMAFEAKARALAATLESDHTGLVEKALGINALAEAKVLLKELDRFPAVEKVNIAKERLRRAIAAEE